ncbi:acyl-CoA dehydrogenase [Halalkalibacter nanhaiisediminis]|uniref:Acyl-CoA dehydrogenase n=1 Tax=Halalkalibacter nanhaiisediminis TaxID=688079 RepID=A0A562QH86_9BACI|nr:acyl-CoA dehydrogenase [Halalkalibacter nanhaiisediminis]
MHNDIVLPYFFDYGNEEQKQRWLPKCISGEYISAIVMTEPGAGSDLAGVRTTAVMQDQLRL